MQSPGSAHCQVNGFLQVLWLTRIFQVCKSRKPLIWTWLGKAAVVGCNYPMHTTALLLWQVRERKVTNLRMDRIDTPIKIHKRGINQLVTRSPPIHRQFRGYAGY